MRLNLKDIENEQSGKIALCIATGPSLRPYIELCKMASENFKDKYAIISVNECDSMIPEIKFDYRVVANSVFTIEKEHNRFNKRPDIKLVYADSVDRTSKEKVQELLKIDYIPYNQRNFEEKNIETIQQFLQKKTGYIDHYGSGSSVSLHMLSLSIILGCSKIYVFGMDLDYNKGYVDGKKYKSHDNLNNRLSDILSDIKIIKYSAEKIGVKIYSSCEDSPINKVLDYKKFSL